MKPRPGLFSRCIFTSFLPRIISAPDLKRPVRLLLRGAPGEVAEAAAAEEAWEPRRDVPARLPDQPRVGRIGFVILGSFQSRRRYRAGIKGRFRDREQAKSTLRPPLSTVYRRASGVVEQ